MTLLAGRHIILGVTGSIAAYKTPQLARDLLREGAELRVVMTPAAERFVSRLVLETLSGHPVIVEMFDDPAAEGTWHIHLAGWADALLVAPASANTLARLAHGFADTALSALALAVHCPLLVAPAMDADMLQHAATRENLRILAARGARIVEPDAGTLASGLRGPGRLPEPSVLIAAVDRALRGVTRDLDGMSLLVTAGPTQEALDPVRYLSNRSSGTMGFAVAAAAAARGARVTLVAGPVHLPTPPGVLRRDVVTAREMADAVAAFAADADAIVMAAAVADFRPARPSPQKIKKDAAATDVPALELERNPDILAALGAQNAPGRILVGFALETENGLAHAREKLERKRCDLLLLNNALESGAGFETDTNRVTLLDANGGEESLPLMMKQHVADVLLDRVAALLARRSA